jgi:hypothetical protein
LFLWKNSASLVPPYAIERKPTEADWVTGRDAAAGFINLLRRTISARDILTVCLEEWKRTVAAPRKDMAAKLPELEAVVAAETQTPIHQRHPVRAYQTLCRIVMERTSVRVPNTAAGPANPNSNPKPAL